MSGYAGNADLESEHALILAENAIRASQSMVAGPIMSDCQDCGQQINPMRVNALRKIGMRCLYCIQCQVRHGIKMLDRIL